MDQKERQVLVTLICSVVTILWYSLHVYHNQVQGNFEILNSFSFWGKTFLWLTPVAIVAQIVIQIIYAIINRIITNEDIPSKNDERDKLIELKAIRISHWFFISGFMLAMVAMALNMQPYVMFVTLFGFGFLSSILSELAKLYYYRRGI
jgi:Na+/H+ antiporter NhaD/arsenite permease-like protein